MILGMNLQTFTLVHVLLSLVGIGSGLIVGFGLLGGKRMNGWTVLFLVTTVLTSATGFLFPVDHLLPSHIVAILSLVALVIAIVARYTFYMAGAWRTTYVVGAVVALYFNCFVGSCRVSRRCRPSRRWLRRRKNRPSWLPSWWFWRSSWR